MSQQSHASSGFREPAGSGAVPTVAPAYLVSSGSDVVPSLTGPDQWAFFDMAQDGQTYTLLKLTPWFLVSDGAGGYQPSSTGPAIAILVDDGANGITLSTNLALAPAADIYPDAAGNLYVVRRNSTRLKGVYISGNLQFY